jgi:hypothetical protein
MINTGTWVYGYVHIESLAASALPLYPLLPTLLSKSLGRRTVDWQTDGQTVYTIPYHIVDMPREW